MKSIRKPNLYKYLLLLPVVVLFAFELITNQFEQYSYYLFYLCLFTGVAVNHIKDPGATARKERYKKFNLAFYSLAALFVLVTVFYQLNS